MSKTAPELTPRRGVPRCGSVNNTWAMGDPAVLLSCRRRRPAVADVQPLDPARRAHLGAPLGEQPARGSRRRRPYSERLPPLLLFPHRGRPAFSRSVMPGAVPTSAPRAKSSPPARFTPPSASLH
jgi:hypothetical protein